ncbi:uncharacterized protein LOC116137225 [Pistacia vera]|uniref:uncharacterized protein LOC116137225 n=1 Tax=Pistacia vera TaxID=55513 RepID=UPI00126316C4|nr:uncharacterized protein LOC116137225 [Pistacia vera]
MSKLFSRLAGFFSGRSLAGMDKAGNRYFTRTEELDGIMKEKRWVVFKGEQDPTSIPVEWICWLNGQRKKAPTPEEMADLEARRERVKLNVALLKKEEEEKRAREGSIPRGTSIGKIGGPDLKSFIKQFPTASEVLPLILKMLIFYFVVLEGERRTEASDSKDGERTKETEAEKARPVPESSEPTGTGASYRPGIWQPPT